jgi:hypothetical protein
MIISIHVEKPSIKFKTFHDKGFDETKNRKNVPQHNKAIYNKPILHNTKLGKTETISSKVRNEQRCLLSLLLFNIVLEFLARAVRQDEEIKGIQKERKKSNYPYFQMT